MADDPLAMAVARPDFTLRRLLLFVTGSINAALVPHWLTWLRHLHPDLVTSLVVTRSAERFVTLEALRAITTGRVWRDSWDEDLPNPGTNAVIEAQLARLHQRPNVAFVETMPAFSLGKGAWAGRTGFHLPALLQTIQQLASQGAAEAS